MPSTTQQTTTELLAELRELTQDVADGKVERARRLTVLRRLEAQLADGDRPRGLAIA